MFRKIIDRLWTTSTEQDVPASASTVNLPEVDNPLPLDSDLDFNTDFSGSDRIFLRFLREENRALSVTLRMKEKVFQRFLLETKQLIQRESIQFPKSFISYSWGDKKIPEERMATRILQDWLLRLRKDLEQGLGIKTFLDIQLIQGDMRECMQSYLVEGDYVLLVGTPSFKERAIQDNLFLIPRFDSSFFPTQGHSVVLSKSTDEAYTIGYLEEGRLVKTNTQRINVDGIVWIDKGNGLQKARIGQHTNRVLEQVLSRKVNNLSFELGFSLDKVQNDYRALIPLVYEGDFGSVFPEEVLENLTRNFSNIPSYYSLMAGAESFLGLIPTIFPVLQSNEQYRRLVLELEGGLSRIFTSLDEQNNQGQTYYNAQNYSQAVVHFKLAAEQGHREAQFNLGRCFYYGYGVALSYTAAVHWYTLAALQGHLDAQNNLGNCYTKGKPTPGVGEPPHINPEVPIDLVRAKYWFERAAQRGYDKAQYNLGGRYEGEGNYAQAVKWYLLAAQDRSAGQPGHCLAQYYLGLLYQEGKGVGRSLDKALEWYERAARQGHSEAQEKVRLLRPNTRNTTPIIVQSSVGFRGPVPDYEHDRPANFLMFGGPNQPDVSRQAQVSGPLPDYVGLSRP